jgi:preprotein translocase subunit SecD
VSPSKSASPTPTKGASVNDPLAWQDNPGSEWIKKFTEFTCTDTPPSAEADDPAKPLITCDSDGNKQLLSKAVIEGNQLKTASFGTPSNGIAWAVNLTFKSDATDTFGKVTTKLAGTGKLFAIVLDGSVLSSPRVIQPILDGRPQITGNFTQQSASSLATSLKYGALPLRFNASVENVGPQLAGNQLQAGIWAGLLGLLLVMGYCLTYYRGLGLVVIGSLIVAGVLTYAAVLVLSRAAGFTLTLPGIAGLIVAVGITADSFIVYFERIRDEMRDGKSMRVAVETGWVRARNTCLAADAVSLLAAIVLYVFAIGVVKGFAFALGLSTVIDLVVFFFFTKPIMTILARRTFFNGQHKMSGLSEETLGIDAPYQGRGALLGGKS